MMQPYPLDTIAHRLLSEPWATDMQYTLHYITCLLLVTQQLAVSLPNTLLRGRSQSFNNSRVWQLARSHFQERWYQQPVDHYAWTSQGQRKWKQRVLLCDKFWRPGGPIFFYAGNEGDVMMYWSNTGFMWENAAQFQALVVFAEHRYYGESQPFGKRSIEKHPQYLSSMQALADFASVMWQLKNDTPGASNSPIIAFGGSYGGVLAAWMRVKYPHLVAGAIAASAPLLAFPVATNHVDVSDYWQVVTSAATPAAGAAGACVNNTRAAFKALLSVANSPEGRAAASRLMRLCNTLESAEDVLAAAYWAQGAWDALAMGNYPYPSSYLSPDPRFSLPAWPMRSACVAMTKTQHMYQADLLEGLANAAGIMYNVSGELPCFSLDVQGPAANAGAWDYQVCTEQVPQEQPYFPANGRTDMFWDQGPYNETFIAEHCQATWGVSPDFTYLDVQYGAAEVLSQTSNIVLSNGLLDPWSAFGVKHNISDTVVAVIIPEGAHHVDLMWSDPADTPSMQQARQVELRHMSRWVADWKQQQTTHLTARKGQAATS